MLIAIQLGLSETRTSELRDTHDAEVKRLEDELERVQRRQSDDVNVAVEQLETVSAHDGTLCVLMD